MIGIKDTPTSVNLTEKRRLTVAPEQRAVLRSLVPVKIPFVSKSQPTITVLAQEW